MREFIAIEVNETKKLIIRTREIAEVLLKEGNIEIYYNSLKPDFIECKDMDMANKIFDGLINNLIYD